MSNIKGNYSEMDILRTKPGDVVVAYFNMDEISVNEATEMHKQLTQVFPEEVSVVTIPDATRLLAYDEEHYIKEMFFNMDQILGRNKYIEALRNELDRVFGDDLK